MQVPVKEREKLLKKEGLDPTRLANLTLVYKVQEVAVRLHLPCWAYIGPQHRPASSQSWLASVRASRKRSLLEASFMGHSCYCSGRVPNVVCNC